MFSVSNPNSEIQKVLSLLLLNLLIHYSLMQNWHAKFLVLPAMLVHDLCEDG